MDGLFKSSAKILLADGDAYMRQSFRNALSNDGYRDIRALSRLSQLAEILNATSADLLILDVEMADGDAAKLVRGIRNGKIGRNPFIAIIATSWESDRFLVRRVIDSGADTLLVKPLAPAQLFSRIQNIVDRRKPFVVTADYMGPDRRDRPDRGGPTRFEVPNTLKDKLEGRHIDTAALNARIEALMVDMNETRLVRASYQLAFLVGMVMNAYEEKAITSETKTQLGRVIAIAVDIATRAAATRFAGVSDNCQSLLTLARQIHTRPRRADLDQVARLKSLANSILTGTYAGGDLANARAKIATEVDDMTHTTKALASTGPVAPGNANGKPKNGR